MLGSEVIRLIVERFVDGAPEEFVKRRMTERIPKIVQGMEDKKMTLEHVTEPTPVIRDALFRLWRTVIPSGDIADLVRDSQDDQIVAVVTPKLGTNKNLTNLVTVTKDEVIRLTF